MGKFTGYPTNTSPQTADVLLEVDSVTGKNREVSLASLITLFFNNIPTGAHSDVTRGSETFFDFVVPGTGVWSADSVGVSRNASMTAATVYINGRRISISAVTSRLFTASVDTYIDVLDNLDGTGTLVYTEVSNNAASPVLAANSVRIGIIQTAATITAATKINQGQEDRVFPIASSIPYTVTDSLGNLICPRDPSRKVLGYRQIIGNFATATSNADVDITGLSVPFIVTVGRKVKAAYSNYYTASTHATGSYIQSDLTDNSNATLGSCLITSAGSAYGNSHKIDYETTPSSASNTWKMRLFQSGTGTATIIAAPATVAALRIEQ